LKLNKIEHAGHAQNSSQLAALPNSTTEIVNRRFLVTVLSLSPALPLVFCRTLFSEGRKEPVTGLQRHPLIDRFFSVFTELTLS